MNAHRPLTKTFRLRLTMLSDWHVGSGAGRPGNIDRLIVRDADGLPFVPAKSLRGIWRDACERLARGLDESTTGDWSRLVDRLFGSQPALAGKDPTGRHDDPVNTPLDSALTVRPARLPEALRQLVTDKQEFVEAMTFVKPGVQIDRRSGRAQTNCLRFEEMGRRGTVLEAGCRVTLPSAELWEAARALLVGAAKLVERLGGKRRRGPGRCALEVVGADTTQALAWLEALEKPPPWTDPLAATSPTPGEFTSAADPWLVLPLVLTLTGPLAVSYRTVGNVVETLDFLPGSYLLPHVTRVLMDLGVDPRAAIQRGDLCVLAAMLDVGEQRGLPTPMALFADKNDPARLVNRLAAAEPVEGQYKQLRAGYVAPGLPLNRRTVPLVVRTHNTVEDGPQRPTSDVGGIYTYEAITPTEKGQPVRLRSELRVRKSLAGRLEQRQRAWWSRLASAVALGRSKKDDYGEGTIEVGEPDDFVSTAPGKPGVVWLLSDTLLRGDDLRPDPTAKALAAELTRRLGVEVTTRASSDGRLDELVRVRRLDTWHVGWGLPRPSLVALQAGSCVAFTIQGDIDKDRLREVEAGGVGERTAEGYGQVCFDGPLLTASSAELTLAKEEMNATRNPGELPAVDPDHADYARLLEREVWKQAIRRTALRIAADRHKREQLLGWRISRDQLEPSMSQLGGLRGQVSQLRGEGDVQASVAWLNHLAANPRRNVKWPAGSIGRIRQLLQDRSEVWTELRRPDQAGTHVQGWPTLTGGAAERLRLELWPLAVRTLIDACIRAHKRDLEAREGNHGA